MTVESETEYSSKTTVNLFFSFWFVVQTASCTSYKLFSFPKMTDIPLVCMYVKASNKSDTEMFQLVAQLVKSVLTFKAR